MPDFSVRPLPSCHDFDHWIFDLDNTLYSDRYDLFSQVEQRITRYVMRVTGEDFETARARQKTYFQKHGTTLRGLMDHHAADPEDYLNFVHDIDYSILPPDPALAEQLNALPGQLYIFTAASAGHVCRTLKALGIREDLFAGIFDIADAEYMPKPSAEPYALFAQRFGIQHDRAVFFEDSPKNLRPAKSLGQAAVHVLTDSAWGQADADQTFIDFQTQDLTSWLKSLPEEPVVP